MFFTQYNKYSIGLDISDRSIKLVQLKKIRQKFKLISLGYSDIPPNIIKQGIIQNQDKLAATVSQGLGRLEGKKLLTKNVIVGLPESQTFIKLISIQTDSTNDIRSHIMAESAKHFPINLDDAYIDWQVINNNDKRSVDVLVAVVTKQVADDYAELVVKIGLQVLAFEIEGAAITRALIGDDLSAPTIILDLGSSHSSLIIIDQNSLRFTASLPISGDDINQTISQKLKISLAQAEKAKIVCGLDTKKCKGALKIVLDAVLDELAYKIEDAVDFYHSQNSKAGSVNTLILTGGGANFLKIGEILSLKTKRKVKLGNSLSFITVKSEKNLTCLKKKSQHVFSTAIGLALRGLKQKL